MVVLEPCVNSTMLTNSSHQYLQPDQFPPLSTSMDAKSSPLAMLQKTCSQIGADSSVAKSFSVNTDKKKDDKKDIISAASGNHSTEKHSTFKPYEMIDKKDERSSGRGSVERHSPSARSGVSSSDRKTPKSISPNSLCSSSGAVGKSTSPIMRSGAEVLASVGMVQSAAATSLPSTLLSKDLSNSLALHRHALLSPLAAAGANELSLRPPLSAAPMLSSASAMSALYGFPLALPPPPTLPTPVRAASVDTSALRCQNPYCTCTHAVDVACPVGCLHCQHAKLVTAATGCLSPSQYLALAAGALPGATAATTAPTCSVSPPSTMTSSPSPTSTSSGSTGVTPPSGSAPLVCSWMADGRYCGKRFTTTDHLMNHLRSHTGGVVGVATSSTSPASAADSPAAALYLLHQQQQQQQLYQAQLLAAAASASAGGHRGVPSQLFAGPFAGATSRYHPYQQSPHSKMPSISTAGSTSALSPPLSSLLSPLNSPLAAQHQSSLAAAAAAAAAAGYYSPYAAAASLYGRPPLP